MSELAADTFTRANAANLGADWTALDTTLQVDSNQAITDTAAVPYSCRHTAISWPNDQYSEIVVGSVVETAGDAGMGPACRMLAGGNLYLSQTGSTDTRLYERVAGVYTQLGSTAAACTTGDALRMVCDGDQISEEKNGSALIGPVTNTSVSSGDAGIWAFKNANGGSAASWSGGDLETGTAPRIVTPVTSVSL